MKKCYKCAYKCDVPGDSHISCAFDWVKSETKPPSGNPHGVKSGWYFFPVNYDPVWMVDDCENFSETIDKDYYVNPNENFIKNIIFFLK